MAVASFAVTPPAQCALAAPIVVEAPPVLLVMSYVPQVLVAGTVIIAPGLGLVTVVLLPAMIAINMATVVLHVLVR